MLMKLINDFVDKIGNDKVLHFLIFALIVSYFNLINIWFGIASFTGMLILSFIKEKWLDNEFNKYDIIAGCIGGILSLLIKFFLV